MFAGLDIGRRHDRTQLLRLDPPRVRDITTLEGRRFADQARILAPLIRGCELCAVDATGLGIGLAEALEDQGLTILRVVIGAGEAVSDLKSEVAPGARPAKLFPGGGAMEARRYSIGSVVAGKGWLMTRIRAAMHRREALVSPDMEGRDVLLSELQRMVPKRTRTGYARLEASAGHDDTVTALALALLARDVHGKAQRQA